jgi:prepilin-type N-terminal cleavage/methylation domain-containing protein
MSGDKQDGFSLVELVIALAVIGIAAAGITSLFISIRNVQTQTSYVDLATRAAQREIELLRNDNYGSLTPGQTIDFTDQLPGSLPRGRTGTVQVSQPTDDLRRIDVTVKYLSGGQQRTITLSSLIGVIGITQ